MGDYRQDAPGVRRKISAADLPAPYATASAINFAHRVRRPPGTAPRVPAGFRVNLFASGLNEPRTLVTAPNGDIFIVETQPGRVLLMRDANHDGVPEIRTTFASRLSLPFGLAFYPPGDNPRYVYVANTGSVVRFPYRSGDTHARGPRETLLTDIPGGGRLPGGGHMTRSLAFSPDGQRMYVSVGSRSNDAERGMSAEYHRACILEYTPGGKDLGVYASGLRNAVGIVVQPQTGAVWASVNERDGLGDNLPPDFITRVQPGGFYGWPWFYIGAHVDPRHRGAHPELRSRSLTPDVLIQAHSASINLAFYTGSQFPSGYQGNIFAAEHGSWNRTRRTGYKVIRVRLQNGVPTGEYDDFATGFVLPGGRVWGRPAGVAVTSDGALLFSDDLSGTIWRVTYTGR